MMIAASQSTGMVKLASSYDINRVHGQVRRWHHQTLYTVKHHAQTADMMLSAHLHSSVTGVEGTIWITRNGWVVLYKVGIGGTSDIINVVLDNSTIILQAFFP